MIGRFNDFSRTLVACRDHCRTLASEVYLGAGRVRTEAAKEANGPTQSSRTKKCQRGTVCFQEIALELETAAPGLNARSITVLGVDNFYIGTDYCGTASERGAMYMEYAAIHSGAMTRQQMGVGVYNLGWLGTSRSPKPGDKYLPFDTKEQAESASCIARMNSWWKRSL
jgi:hypothetical protein